MKFIELISDWLVKIKDTPCDHFIRDVLKGFENLYDEELIKEESYENMFNFVSSGIPRLRVRLEGDYLIFVNGCYDCMILATDYYGIDRIWLGMVDRTKKLYSFLPILKYNDTWITSRYAMCTHCGLYISGPNHEDEITNRCCREHHLTE